LDGLPLQKTEEEAKLVQIQIEDDSFKQLFDLVDGIHPKHLRSVKGLTVQSYLNKIAIKPGRNVPRKDFEQAFYVHSYFKVMEHPILCHSLSKMSAIVPCVSIMHNRGDSNQVKEEDVHDRIDPYAKINVDYYDDINKQNLMSNLDLSYDNTARNQQAQNNLLDWKTPFPLFPRLSGTLRESDSI
jgi:Plant transposon protein